MSSSLISILSKTTLSEYLRSRRLTEAAVILRDTDEKIIDFALKFGYESSDSLGTAFKNFHKFTPSDVRNGKPFKLVSRWDYSINVKKIMGKGEEGLHDYWAIKDKKIY